MNYAIITVDTEGHDGKNPIDKLVWGRLSDGTMAGIDMIMDIAEEYGTKALFFVDFAEAWHYGKDKITTVVRHISERNHDVGVHIHADHMKDKSKLFLYEYSKEEQYEIIKKCTDLYEEILGKRPICFRAGKYSANIDTLDIINELGYKYDFSEFMGQKWCGIKPEITADRPCKYKNLIELPVTVFKSAEMTFFKRFDKLDMEMVYSQFEYVVRELAEGEGNVISLFLHSFSLVKWRKNPNEPTLWEKNIKKYRKCLAEIKKLSNMKLISMVEFDECVSKGEICIPEKGNKEPQVKVKNWWRAYYFLFTTSVRIAEHNKKARVFITLNIVAIGIVLIAVIMLFLLL